MMKTPIWPLLLFSIIQLPAQQFSNDSKNFNVKFEVFTIPGGPLANSVNEIVQDKIGYVWFGSHAGLHRFDGQNFRTFRQDVNNPNSLASDHIEDIFIDSQGILWLAQSMQGGLTSFNPETETFAHYRHEPDNPETLSGNNLLVVTEDRQGYIWVGGDSGLDRLDRKTGKVKRFHHDENDPHSLSYNLVGSIYEDRQGTLWVGTGFAFDQSSKGGLNRYDATTQSFTNYVHHADDPTSLISNKVRALLEDSKGNFWVGTDGDGLHLMDRKKGTFTRLGYDPLNPGKFSRPVLVGTSIAQSNAVAHVTRIFEDLNGRIWIAAIYGGLNVYDPVSGTSRHFESMDGLGYLAYNFFWVVNQTRDGTLWVATGDGDQKVFKVKQLKDLIPFEAESLGLADTLYLSHGILKDPKGNVWIAHDQPDMAASLTRIDQNTGHTTAFQFKEGNKTAMHILGVSLDRKGNIWVGTDLGQFKGDHESLDFQIFKPKGIPDELQKSLSSPAFQSSAGLMWFGGDGAGVSVYDEGTGEFLNFKHDPTDPKSLGGNFVWGIHEDAQGDIWIGGGRPDNDINNPIFLDRFNLKTRTAEHFLKNKAQLGIAAYITSDRSGNIWFTDKNYGFEKLDPSTGMVKKITPSNSILPPETLTSIHLANDGKLWISGEHSLIQFDPETETMSVFGASHGVKHAVGFFGAGSKTTSGELLFSRRGGYHVFRPEQVIDEKNSRKPDLLITDFRLLHERRLTGENSILKDPIWRTSGISLNHTENAFSLAIACFEFYDPSTIQLQFKLEDYDRDWRQDILDGVTPAYINVPPGEYTFRLRGANSFGIWDKEGIALQIIVRPPWWKTWWAYSIYTMLALTGIYFVHLYQKDQVIKSERERTRAKELEQAREIEKAYKELKATQSQLINSEKMASLGELTAGIAHEIQNPLNFVNNFSEVNNELIEELNLEVSKGNFSEVEEIAKAIQDNGQKIVHHGKRADAIVKGMLMHSRTSTGIKEPTDMNALCDEYLRLCYHGLRAKDKSFNAIMKTDFDPSLMNISVIPQDIGRAVLNLLTNAFYAVAARKKQSSDAFEPTVSISTRKMNNRVEIVVCDNGSGIPKNILEKIFQPFFTTKPSGQGTGLGLSLSYDIVKAHGGEIKVNSKEGEGTEFTVSIPVS